VFATKDLDDDLPVQAGSATVRSVRPPAGGSECRKFALQTRRVLSAGDAVGAVAAALTYPVNRLTISVMFWPPKPKLLLSATSQRIWRAWLGT